MSTLQTHVQQWTLTHGVRSVHSDLLITRFCAPQWAPRRTEQVFVAVQTLGDAPRDQAAGALVAETLVTAFANDPARSITSALRRAFAAAHAALCAHNAHLPPVEHTFVGAHCAVLHNTALYVASVQPAYGWVQHHGHVRALPAMDNSMLVDSAQALGSPWYTTPELTHTPVAVGDVVVLCSPNVAQAIQPAHVETALRTGDANTVAGRLFDLCPPSVDAGHVLAIAWSASASQRVRTPTDEHAHTPPHVLAHDHPVPTNTTAPPSERRVRGTRRAHATLNDAQPRGQTTPVRRTPDRLPERSRRLHQAQAKRGARSGHRGMPWRSLVALLLVCSVALAGGAAHQFQHHNTGVALAAIAQLQHDVTLAERANTTVDAQRALATAQTTLRTQVEPFTQSGVITTTQPVVWQQYTEAVRRYEQAMAVIDHVTFVDGVHTVVTLPGAQALIDRIVLGTPAQPGQAPPVFMLDRSTSTVWQAGQPVPLLGKGTVVDGVPVVRLRDALWRDNTLLLLERGDQTAPAYRVLYQNNGRWTNAPLARTDTMALLDGDLPITTFANNVYVWDRTTHQAWQYAANQGDAPPTPTIGNIGMALPNVVDIAVAERTYLLNGDGSIVVIEHGAVVQQWPAPQLAVPLSTVARLVVTPASTGADGAHQPGAIYVLDTQHERVLQLDKATGAVLQQWQARQRGTFNQLTDLAVDEAGRMMYLANGKTVLQVPLRFPPDFGAPAPPEPAK